MIGALKLQRKKEKKKECMLVYYDAQVLTNYTFTYSGRNRLYANVETILKWSDSGACQTLTSVKRRGGFKKIAFSFKSECLHFMTKIILMSRHCRIQSFYCFYLLRSEQLCLSDIKKKAWNKIRPAHIILPRFYYFPLSCLLELRWSEIPSSIDHKCVQTSKNTGGLFINNWLKVGFG